MDEINKGILFIIFSPIIFSLWRSFLGFKRPNKENLKKFNKSSDIPSVHMKNDTQRKKSWKWTFSTFPTEIHSHYSEENQIRMRIRLKKRNLKNKKVTKEFWK